MTSPLPLPPSPYRGVPPCGDSGREKGRRPLEVRDARCLFFLDKSLAQGMTFNRSQRGSCSATHETLTQNQVVYE